MHSACIVTVTPVSSSFAGCTATVHDNSFLHALMNSCVSVKPRSVITFSMMWCTHVTLCFFCVPHSVLHWLHRQRQKRSRLSGTSTFPGGEDFPDKFAPPMVLFMAEEQVQQLGEHTRKVEIDSAPSWTCFEYVLDASSSVNAILETALRCGLLHTTRLHGNACWSCRQSQQQQ